MTKIIDTSTAGEDWGAEASNFVRTKRQPQTSHIKVMTSRLHIMPGGAAVPDRRFVRMEIRRQDGARAYIELGLDAALAVGEQLVDLVKTARDPHGTSSRMGMTNNIIEFAKYHKERR